MIDRAYFEPVDLKQARSMLAKHPDARLVAGGTDIVVAARSGKSALPQSLVAIHGLKTELSGIEVGRGGRLRIGALATHSDLEESDALRRSWTALADASALVGSPATRHLGTVGGNVCNASPAMELGSPLLIFDAEVELVGKGRRRVPFGTFVTGPGRTDARPGEMLTAVLIPRLSSRGKVASAYVRLEYRRAMEIAIVGAAAMIAVDRSGRCKDARVALTAVAPTCVRAPGAEEVLRGNVVDSALLNRAAAAAGASAAPIDDVRASADYRKAMVQVIVRRALAQAVERLGQASAR